MIRILKSYLKDFNNRVFDINSHLKNLNFLENVQEGCRKMKKESSLFLKEIRNGLSFYKDFVPPDVVDIVWKFDGTAKCQDQWVLTCDADYAGHSTAKLDFSSSGTGLFHGILNTYAVKDGTSIKSGFCNITTIPIRKSFQRRDYYKWDAYNCLVLRIRGDGRCYMLNLLHDTLLNDKNRSDCHHYIMYTSGGPYWQDVKIPFAKFVYSVNGIAQADQLPISYYTIERFGITLGDNKNGPFKLEIDYIGVCYDPSTSEICAYEPEGML